MTEWITDVLTGRAALDLFFVLGKLGLSKLGMRSQFSEVSRFDPGARRNRKYEVTVVEDPEG